MMQKSKSFIDVITECIESDNVVLPVFNSAALRVQQELVKKEPDMKMVENILVRILPTVLVVSGHNMVDGRWWYVPEENRFFSLTLT